MNDYKQKIKDTLRTIAENPGANAKDFGLNREILTELEKAGFITALTIQHLEDRDGPEYDDLQITLSGRQQLETLKHELSKRWWKPKITQEQIVKGLLTALITLIFALIGHYLFGL